MASTVVRRLASPFRQWEERRALRAAREAADAEILATRLAPPRLAWRSAELLDPAERIELVRALTSAVHDSDERYLPGASPLDRPSIRACRTQLLELGSRLSDLDHPVTPRGIVAVHRLLEDSQSPLYGHGDGSALRAAAERALRFLDGHAH